jgi:hypothetical protein
MSKRYFNLVQILIWTREQEVQNRVCSVKDCKEWGSFGINENNRYHFLCGKHYPEKKAS